MKNKYFSVFTILPVLFSFTCLLFLYSSNFSINGASYEIFFVEVLKVFFLFFMIHILFYFIMSRFSFFLHFLLYFELLFILFFFLKFPVWILFLSFFILLSFKKVSVTFSAFFDAFTTIFSIMTCFLFLYHFGLSLYYIASFHNREKVVEPKYPTNIDSSLPSPNIYWIHMDGMPSLSFMEKYYDASYPEFTNFLEEHQFRSSNDSSIQVGHHTLTSLAAMYNPNYYDSFLKSYLKELDDCSIKHCKVGNTVSFDEITYHRLYNEMFHAFQKKGYSIVSITEFNQYTSFLSDYTYDLSSLTNSFIPKYSHISDEDTFSYIYDSHFHSFIQNIFGYSYPLKNYTSQKVKYSNFSAYPFISKSSYLPVRAALSGIEDSKLSLSNPRFTFIDQSIMHLNWNYDENGKKIGDHNTNLDDFLGNYTYTLKLLEEMILYIQDRDPSSVIIIQGDHGIHFLDEKTLMNYFHISREETLSFRNSVMSACFIPDKSLDNQKILDNPLNISRYLINHYVGNNYEYLK